jgi:fucose 4-O-acetylase-like acetyltransferase
LGAACRLQSTGRNFTVENQEGKNEPGLQRAAPIQAVSFLLNRQIIPRLAFSMRSDSKPGERTVWIDVCKGLCIVLVVYGHISGGLAAAGTLAADSIWMKLRDWVYLFHMPAFFVLSGIFAPRLSQLSVREFLSGRLRTIFYPYVIWTAIIVASQFAMARFVNNPPEFLRALYFLVEPYGYGLWFLYSLFIISVIFYSLARWRVSPLIMVFLAATLSLLASRNFFSGWPILNTSMNFFIFYAAAACAREKIFTLFSQKNWLAPLLAGTGFLLAMTLFYLAGFDATWLLNLLLAGLGITGIICLAKSFAQIWVGQFWAFLGVFSLEIYLGHPLWGTISRVLLIHARITSPAILVFGGVVLGIAGSLLVGVLCRAGNFPYLFKWPAKAAAKS